MAPVILSAYGEKREFLKTRSLHPLTCLLLNENSRIFVDEHGQGVGYVQSGSRWLSIGGVLTSQVDATGRCLNNFLRFVDASPSKVQFVHIPLEQINMFRAAGFALNNIGSSYCRLPDTDWLKGKPFRQVRRKINYARREGMAVREIQSQIDFDSAMPQLAIINKEWQKKKAKPLRHMVSVFDEIDVESDDTRFFVAEHEGRLISFTCFTRCCDTESSWFHNLSRRRTGCIDGSMQLIVTEFLKAEGSAVSLQFGFTPLVDLQSECIGGSKLFHKLSQRLEKMGGVIYPARSQLQYKRSWSPQIIIPEYVAYRGNPLLALWSMVRTTNAI